MPAGLADGFGLKTALLITADEIHPDRLTEATTAIVAKALLPSRW